MGNRPISPAIGELFDVDPRDPGVELGAAVELIRQRVLADRVILVSLSETLGEINQLGLD